MPQKNHKETKKKLTIWEKLFSGFFWAVLIIILILVIYMLPGSKHELNLDTESFQITGSYGDTWSYQDIKSIRLVDELPEIKGRVFGKTTSTARSGHFSFQEGEPYEKGMLFVHRDTSPYILMEFTNHKPVFLNAEDPVITNQWFEHLSDKISE